MATSIFGMKNVQMQCTDTFTICITTFLVFPNYRRQRHFPIAFRVMTALKVFVEQTEVVEHNLHFDHICFFQIIVLNNRVIRRPKT